MVTGRRIPNRVLVGAAASFVAVMLLAATGHGGPAYDDTGGATTRTTSTCQGAS